MRERERETTFTCVHLCALVNVCVCMYVRVAIVKVLADETTLAVDGSLTSNTFSQAVRHRRSTNIAIGHRLVWVSARLVCVRERSFVCKNLYSHPAVPLAHYYLLDMFINFQTSERFVNILT